MYCIYVDLGIWVVMKQTQKLCMYTCGWPNMAGLRGWPHEGCRKITQGIRNKTITNHWEVAFCEATEQGRVFRDLTSAVGSHIPKQPSSDRFERRKHVSCLCATSIELC